MLGGADRKVTAGIRFVSDTKAVEKARKQLDRLSRGMKETVASSTAMAESNRRAARAMDRVTTSAGSSSAGLSAYQAQQVNTAATTETLSKATSDFGDSLEGISSIDASAALENLWPDQIKKIQKEGSGAFPIPLDSLRKPDSAKGDFLPEFDDYHEQVRRLEKSRGLLNDIAERGGAEQFGKIFGGKRSAHDFIHADVTPADRIDDLIDDDELANRFHRLNNLMMHEGRIAKELRKADHFGGAIDSVQRADLTGVSQLNQWAQTHPEEIDQLFQGMGDTMKQVDKATPDDVDRRLDPSKLNIGQQEDLARLVAGLTGSPPPGIGGSGFPFDDDDVGRVPRELLEMGIMQEMLDEDPDSARFRGLQDILTRTMAGDLTEATVLHDQGIMEGVFQQDLARRLPDNLVEDHNLDRLLTKQLQQVGPGVGISEVLGPGGELDSIIDSTLRDLNIDDPRAARELTRATDQALPELRRFLGQDIAPGMLGAERGVDDFSLEHLFPNMDELPDPDDADAFRGAIRNHTEGISEGMAELRRAQRRSRVLRGGALTGITGKQERPRGIFGTLLAGETGHGIPGERALLGGLRQGLLTPGTDVRTPRGFTTLQKNLENMNGLYQDALPLLQATSIRLGSVNVNFESMGIMIFKLTAMLGPLVAGLLGLAAAAGTTAIALGSLVAVGAVGFLDEMEKNMAGVTDKTEAMGELTDKLKTMAWQAVEPLRLVSIGGDGPRGMQLFVGVIRGALFLLHRFARIFAEVLRLPEFADALERIHNWIYDINDDMEFAEDLRHVVRRVLPLLGRIASAVVSGIGPTLEFFSMVTERLGHRVMDVASDMSTSFRLMTAYGAGFMDFALLAVGVIGKLVNAVTRVVEGFAWLISLIPGINTDATRMVYIMGAVVGVMNVMSRVATFLAAKKIALSKAAFLYVKAAHMMTVSSLTLTKALLGLTGVLLGATLFFIAMYDIVRALSGESGLFFQMDSWKSAIGAVTVALAGLSMLVWSFYVTMLPRWIAGVSKVATATKSTLLPAITYATGLIIDYTKAIVLHTKAKYGASVASKAFAGSLLMVAKSALIAGAALALIAGGLILIHDALAPLFGRDAIFFEFESTLGRIVGVLWGVASVIGGVLMLTWRFGTALARVSGILKVIKYAVIGLVKVLSAPLIIVGLLVALLFDLLFYLGTGESLLANWIPQLQFIEQVWERIAGLIERVSNFLTPSTSFGSTAPSVRQSGEAQWARDQAGLSAPGSRSGGTGGGSTRNSQAININLNNNGWIGDDGALRRMIRQELRNHRTNDLTSGLGR